MMQYRSPVRDSQEKGGKKKKKKVQQTQSISTRDSLEIEYTLMSHDRKVSLPCFHFKSKRENKKK